ncbi:hypothetical protein OG308_15790 [Nocardia salmonicida]|uniref:Uncharacterized protein n=1 Tax=Nocardia salmonicida TaxID=53431 RepID=A0ABZ1NHB5_9NOCA
MTQFSLSVFPMKMEVDATISQQILSRGASDLIDLQWLAGVTNGTEEPVSVLVMEVPHAKSAKRSKQEQETDDVLAFLSACNLSSNALAVVPGPDGNEPPDCLADVGDRRYAIEAAQLMLPSPNSKANSVARWRIFEQLSDELFRQSGRLQSRLRQHRGHMVTVWFNFDSDNRLPPRNGNISEMVDHLKNAHPPIKDDFEPIYRGLPKTIPPNTAIKYNESKSVGCTWTALPPTYQSALQRAIGFDIGLAYYETYTQSMLRAELRRVIEQHDDPRSDILVLTVGAETRGGIYFPSTKLFADALFVDQSPLDGWQPRALPAVAIHDAHNNRVRWIHGDPPFAQIRAM